MFRLIRCKLPLVTRNLNHVSSRQFQPCLYRFMTTVDTVLGKTAQEKQELWTTFCERSRAQDATLTEKDFLDICKVTIYNEHIEPEVIIQRLQSILREIHERKQDNERMKLVFVKACNMLMQAFINKGDVKSAKLVLEGLINTGHTIMDSSINTILSGIARHGVKADVYTFINTLKERHLFIENANVYGRIISVLKQFNDLRGCRYFFGVMKEKGYDIDEICYKNMMEVYKASKQPDMVLSLFKELKAEKGVHSIAVYNVLFSSLNTDKSKAKIVQQIFDELKQSGLALNSSIYLALGWDPMEAMKDMKQSGWDISVRDYNTFLASCVKKNQFPKALEIFKMMKKHDMVTDTYSYSILIDALAKDIDTPPQAVFDLYENMKSYGIQPDVVLYTSLLSACSRSQDLDKAMSLLEEMESHNVKPNLYTFNSILGLMATMAGASSIDLDRASLVWTKMTSMNIQPDTRTFNIYLSIVSKLIKPGNPVEDLQNLSLWDNEEQPKVPRTVREMLRMYRYMRRNNQERMQPDFLTYTIVINALAYAGQLRSAMQVYGDCKLNQIELPVTTYNEIMNVLLKSGKASEAMNVWHDMRIQSILPDNTTYEIILEACEQLGLSETIKSIRNQRKLDFNRLLDLEKQKEKRMSNNNNNNNKHNNKVVF